MLSHIPHRHNGPVLRAFVGPLRYMRSVNIRITSSGSAKRRTPSPGSLHRNTPLHYSLEMDFNFRYCSVGALICVRPLTYLPISVMMLGLRENSRLQTSTVA
jgi:hypothetical protein